MTIAVAGGTGLVGSLVVEEVRRLGGTAVVLARATGVDLVSGEGLTEALTGVDTVVDAADVGAAGAAGAAGALAFVEAVTANLLLAGRAAGVRHHVALSVVGCDRVDVPYHQAKRRQEDLVAAGPVPWTVLRATQLHESARQLVARSPGRVALAPRMRTRPIAAREVAEALVAAAVDRPGGLLPDLAGPRPERLDLMVRQLVRRLGRRHVVVPVPIAGAAGRQVAAGGLLPGRGASLGRETFGEWVGRA